MIRSARISLGAFALGLALLGAGAAAACSPAPFAAGTKARDGACGLSWYDEAYLARSISDAEQLGSGMVLQYYFEGNACWGSVSMIVVDCQEGEAAIFGPGPTEGPMQPAAPSHPFKVLEARVLAAAARVEPLAVSRIVESAAGRFENAARVAVPGSVGISNDGTPPRHSFALGCGCKVFYPGSAGAGS